MLVDPRKLVLIGLSHPKQDGGIEELDIIWVDRETTVERFNEAHRICGLRWPSSPRYLNRAFPFYVDYTFTPRVIGWGFKNVFEYLGSLHPF